MEFQNFIKRVNLIYNILFIILLFLCLCGIGAYYYLYKNNMIFLNSTYSMITILSITCASLFFVYFILYAFRLIYNKICILRLFKYNINDDIENDFYKIRFKKDQVIITDNYLIVGAYLLKIIKLEEINSIFLTHNYKYEYIKYLHIICKNHKRYTIHEYYAEEIFENIQKYIKDKNPNVSFKATKQDDKIIDKQIITYEIFLIIIVIVLFVLYKIYLY